uniref:MFS domain-containing protein n=1 Tax=Macrostomum lignano TaxID=282301 RepID=A0A1I8FKR6_9PLAT
SGRNRCTPGLGIGPTVTPTAACCLGNQVRGAGHSPRPPEDGGPLPAWRVHHRRQWWLLWPAASAFFGTKEIAAEVKQAKTNVGERRRRLKTATACWPRSGAASPTGPTRLLMLSFMLSSLAIQTVQNSLALYSTIYSLKMKPHLKFAIAVVMVNGHPGHPIGVLSDVRRLVGKKRVFIIGLALILACLPCRHLFVPVQIRMTGRSKCGHDQYPNDAESQVCMERSPNCPILHRRNLDKRMLKAAAAGRIALNLKQHGLCLGSRVLWTAGAHLLRAKRTGTAEAAERRAVNGGGGPSRLAGIVGCMLHAPGGPGAAGAAAPTAPPIPDGRLQEEAAVVPTSLASSQSGGAAAPRVIENLPMDPLPISIVVAKMAAFP